MNDATIHALDRWLGRPFCWILTAVRRVLPEPVYTYPPRSILFLKLVEQGATVLAYGAIQRAADLVGRDNVYIAVFEENRPILDLTEWIPRENVLSIRSGRFPHFLLDTCRVLRRCRKLRMDAVIDMEHFARASAILAFLIGARIRVGLHRYTMEAPYRGDLLTHKLLYSPYLHTARYYDLLVKAMAFPPNAFPMIPVAVDELSMVCPRFHPPTAVITELRHKLEAEVTLSKPIVVLNPNAADRIPGRKWPVDRYADVARHLLETWPELVIVITGMAEERGGAQAITRAIGDGRVVDLTGRTSFAELISLYSIADLLITNDSGPAHFASMTPIDVVVLFGPETPALYGPIGEHVHVVYKELVCSPAVSALNHRVPPANDDMAMRAIEVDEVVAVARRVLAERSTSHVAILQDE